MVHTRFFSIQNLNSQQSDLDCLDPEDGTIKRLQILCNYLPINMASYNKTHKGCKLK